MVHLYSHWYTVHPQTSTTVLLGDTIVCYTQGMPSHLKTGAAVGHLLPLPQRFPLQLQPERSPYPVLRAMVAHLSLCPCIQSKKCKGRRHYALQHPVSARGVLLPTRKQRLRRETRLKPLLAAHRAIAEGSALCHWWLGRLRRTSKGTVAYSR